MEEVSVKSKEVLLSVQGLGKNFGGITALTDYNLVLPRGQIAGLIGPNGAGKTTAFNLLSGVITPSLGAIVFDGTDITGMRPDQKAKIGITRTFQNIRLFEHLSVLDNIRIALHMRHGSSPIPTLLHVSGFRRSERDIEHRAADLLALLDIGRYREEAAGNLPYGDQRRVEIARALATEPRLLLLDEPAAGLNPHETDYLMHLIDRIHQEYELTILLVEHDMKVIMGICRSIQVLDQGRLIADGSPEEIQANPRVVKAYLGAGSGNDGTADIERTDGSGWTGGEHA